VILTSKVDGKEHEVVQVVDVLDPSHPRFNPDAVDAMTADHADVECYTCHAGWNVNFLGFHFSRNESLTQLDLLSGKRTPGRVTTQEKVFATWKSFYAGLNERGAVAPYMHVKPRKYRFRIVNSGPSRIYTFQTCPVGTDGVECDSDNRANDLVIIGNDGNLLNSAVAVENATISSAERLDIVIDFAEKLPSDGWVSGGFFAFRRSFLEYLPTDQPEHFFEQAPVQELTREKKFGMFPHTGFWMGMDTFREYTALNDLWARGEAPWKIW